MLRDAPARESHYTAEVVENIPDGSAVHLVLRAETSPPPEPGQFLHVTPRRRIGSDPLLRRPFSVSDWDADRGYLRLLIAPVGRVSRLLSGMEPGDELDILGPLGTPFPSEAAEGKNAVLIAGGIGVAPLLFLTRTLLQREIDTTVFVGGAGSEDLLARPVFEQLGASIHLCTEDGSVGHEGLVTDMVDRFLQQTQRVDNTVIFCCGPDGMLYAVTRLSRRYDIPAYGSFEAHMACGVGACMGCSIARAHPQGKEDCYLRVCREGPVFALKEVIQHG